MRRKFEENLVYVVVVAGVVLRKNSKYLLVQEKNPRCYKLWNLPAGRVEIGQTIKETAIKEAKEETGYDIRIIRELAIFHGDCDEAVKHSFEAKITSGKLNYPKDEILNVKWFDYEEIKELKIKKQLRSDWILKSIDILENRK